MGDLFAFASQRSVRANLVGCFRAALLVIFLAAAGTVCVHAQRIKVYPQTIRLDKGTSRTITALEFDRTGRYLPGQKFTFLRTSGQPVTASIRSSVEGDTEGNDSRYSRNLAEIRGLEAGVATFVASIDGLESPPVTVTVVDPADVPLSVIKGDNEEIDGVTIRVRVGEAVEVNAESSRGVRSAEWFWGDGDRTGDLLSATHAYLVAGTYQLRLRITNSAGLVAESSVSVIVSSYPPPTHTFTVTTMAQLLAAYNQCTGGEHIIIPAGMVLTGSVELPPRPFTDFVTIRSSSAMPDMPVRTTPRQSDLAILRGSYPNEVPMLIRNRASKIRLSGLRFEPYPASDDTIQNYYLLQIGEAFGQTASADNPSKIIIDHCLVDPPDNIQVVHAILNDGYKVSIISSWLGNIRTYGSQDSQAVFSLDGRGAHVYHNTYFEAASESVIYGGAGNKIDGNVPTNIEFRRCVFAKRLAWRDLAPNSAGDSLNEKNLFETKNARRVYVEGSIFSNHWDADRSQFFAITLKSTADQPDGDQGSPWSVSEDIVFENDRISHINGGMSVTRDFGEPGIEYDPLKPRNIRILNTLFDDLTFGRWGTNRGWSFHISGVDDLMIRHVSVIDAIDTPDESQELMLSINSVNSYRPDIADSILPLNYYGIRNSCGEGISAMNVGTSGWFDVFSGSSCDAASGKNAGSWRIAGNVLPKMRSLSVVGIYPALNSYPENYSAIRMQAYRNCGISPFSDPCESSPVDFSLRADSPFRNTATDGTDPGINAALLAERIRCTASGDTRACISSPAAGFEGDLAPRPNGDGSVLTNDLTLLRGFVSGLLTPTGGTNEFQRADIAPYATLGDGRLTASDIAQMRNYISGFNPPEPAGGPAEPIGVPMNDVGRERPALRVRKLKIGDLLVNDNADREGRKGEITLEVDSFPSSDQSVVTFTLEYDALRFSHPRLKLPAGMPVDTALTVNNKQEDAGILGIVIDSSSAFVSAGSMKTILLVTFDAMVDAGPAAVAITDRLVVMSSSDNDSDACLQPRRFWR